MTELRGHAIEESQGPTVFTPYTKGNGEVAATWYTIVLAERTLGDGG
jgi:hypothetical protein